MCPSNYFRHPCPIPRLDFAHPLRTTCVQGPFCCPPGELGSDQCPLRVRGFCLKPCYSRSGMVASPRMAGLGSRRPSKIPPYRDWLSACTKITTTLSQNTFSGPHTRWAPLRTCQGMCPSLSSAIPAPLSDPILRDGR